MTRFPIRAISLDLDDTLWPIWPVIERAEGALHAYLEQHCPSTAERYPLPVMRALREQVAREHPHLAHDFTEQRLICLRRALDDSGDDPAHALPAFEALYVERNRVEFYTDTLPALDRLGAALPLAVITNGNSDLQRIGIATRFATVVSARGFGTAKPEAAIFRHTAQSLGIPAAALLHVGDDPELDVAGAARAGLRTCWINRRGEAWPAHLPPPDLHFTCLGGLADWLEHVQPHTHAD
jgi:putative hydrolase of the HAD superfamily